MKKTLVVCLLLSLASLITGCAVSITQQPLLASLAPAEMSAEPGSVPLIVDQICVRVKLPFQPEASVNPSADFKERFLSALRETGIFYSVYDSLPLDSQRRFARLRLEVDEGYPLGFRSSFNQTMTCSIQLPDGTMRIYRTTASGTSFSSQYVVGAKVTDTNLESIKAQMRADSLLIHAVH